MCECVCEREGEGERERGAAAILSGKKGPAHFCLDVNQCQPFLGCCSLTGQIAHTSQFSSLSLSLSGTLTHSFDALFHFSSRSQENSRMMAKNSPLKVKQKTIQIKNCNFIN